MAVLAPPVQVVASGAPPFVQVPSGAPPFVVTTGPAPPIVMVDSGAPPITLFNADGSLWSAVPAVPAAPVNTVLPVISGTPTVGQTISTTTGTWTGYPTPTYTYQWKRAGGNIAGATASTYTLVPADTAALITVTVTATNASGSASATSPSFGTINLTPSNAVAPVISGTATVAQVLSCTTGTWAGTPVPTYGYQWQRGGANIGGATASTYTLVVADIGATMTCVVTATNTAGSSSATSNSLGPVAGAAPVNTVLPAISGTPTTGQTLTSSTGTWTGTPTPTYAYQWKRAGTAIGGATSSTYLLVVADESNLITVTVTATNVVGSASATSASVGPIAPAVSGGGAALLTGEALGFAADFLHSVDAQRVAVKT